MWVNGKLNKITSKWEMRFAASGRKSNDNEHLVSNNYKKNKRHVSPQNTLRLVTVTCNKA